MDRTTRRLFVAALAVLVTAVGVVAFVSGGAGSPATTVPPDAQEAVGVVTSIESEGLADVRGFTLRQRDGAELEFTIGRLENGAEFPPGHLAEHQATVTAIRVFYRDEGDARVVFRMEDAE